MNCYLRQMFINIQNGYLSRCNFILQPRQANCELILKILWKEGFILGYQISYKNKKKIKIFLKYKNNNSVLKKLKILSKSSCKIFYSSTEVLKINSNKLFVIFFTKYGVKTIDFCRKYQIGGEPIVCFI